MKVSLLVFAKAPVAGQVKTRLIPALGAERAARLHAALVEHTLQTCRRAQVPRVELWCDPAVSDPFFVEMSRRYGVPRYRQRKGDLGERMVRALADALRRSDAAVLLGTDAPTIAAEDLRSAVEALGTGTDAVLAPAFDGGYVLIGLRRTVPALFRDVRWGGAGVLQQTRERLESLGYRWREIRSHHDIDRPEDWERLLERDPAWAERTARISEA